MRNELLMNMNNLQSMGGPQFSAMFGLEQGGQHNNFDGQKSRLPLCLDQNSSAFLASTSNGLPNELFQQTSNIYGLSSPALPRILKEEEDSTNGNMSSMYYNNNSLNHHQDTSQGHMSATALLQKAATMGSTRSNSPGIFANTFGLMNSTMSSNLHSFSSLSPTNMSASNQGVFHHHNNVARASDRLMMMMEEKHMHGNLMNCNQMEGGMTRDFLGVGGNNNHHNIISTGSTNDTGEIEKGRPFLQQELQVKFGSMSSTMDLGQQYSCTTTGSH